ncbi:MAG: inositol monophosphatase family protein [Anaeromyxobacter sp.]
MDLTRALEVAVSAAHAAGELLRREFFRAGGPRGEPGHCPADGEAEVLIRERLMAAFPDHGFVAEEAPEHDRPPRVLAGPTWFVDPNDGTSDFQRGLRGATVSIGLVQDGVPVLGVVLAHTAPFGGQRLFTWAEGLGPARVDGRPLPSLDPAPLRSLDLVVVSGGAADRVRGMAGSVGPARFRPQSSAAYRLALAAAGEARAAVTLGRPRALDVVAGHALLRGVGGVMLDEGGREPRYPTAGGSRLVHCFGGPPAVAAALAARDWRPATGQREPVKLTAPALGRLLEDAGQLRRAQGALLGQLCGDALGAQVEFLAPEEIARRHPGGVRELADGGEWNTLAGQPTDDSELALALARALVEAGGFDEGRVAEAYAAWMASDPFDVGGTIRAALTPAAQALAAGQRGAAVAAVARAAARPESKANGALMRVSPLGVAGHAARPAALWGWARADAALTHPAAVCQDASGVMALAIAQAVHTGACGAALADRAEAQAAQLGAGEEVRAALAAARHGPPASFVEHAGLVSIALQNAFHLLRREVPLEEALVETVGRGGDPDTNAAIAGALLGAAQGVEAVPARWREAVLSCWPVSGLPGVKRARPPACWPVDALVLAERLAGL